MDNLSHSLAGLAAGELVHRLLPVEANAENQRGRRALLLATCWLASNFPDLDLVLTPLLPAPLGYLLHHRGHTHTLLYALPQALLLASLLWLLWPAARRLLKASVTARSGFVLSLAVGFGLHIAMDTLNSYGIHPFHPFDSRWLYGDLVFILEPVFWIAFGVPMAMMVGWRWLRVLLLALLAGVPLFFTTKGFLPWSSLATLAVLAVLLAGVQLRAGKQGTSGLWLGVAAVSGFVVVQAIGAMSARQSLEQYLHSEDPASRVLDLAMTPFPSNPRCWIFVSVQSNEEAGTYRLQRGHLSTTPETLPVGACPPALAEQLVPARATATIAIHAEHEGRLAALRTLSAENCHFNAWMRFARAPVLAGSGDYALDLRFMSASRGNFTTIRLDDFQKRACSAHVPQWDHPRADMLEQGGKPASD
jgi:inner membrane protein